MMTAGRPLVSADRPNLPDAFESVEELAGVLNGLRNDLEAPAIALNPLIGEALDTLRDEPETLLARMSGSGATCFALCAGDIEAEGAGRAALALRSARPTGGCAPAASAGPGLRSANPD